MEDYIINVGKVEEMQMINDVAGLDERTWEGQCLRIGNVVIGVEDLRDRCVMTTYDPDTLEQSPNVLKDIVKRFDGKLALNCYVIEPGEIRVGEAVELIRGAKCKELRRKIETARETYS